jgi:hypothetical protein
MDTRSRAVVQARNFVGIFTEYGEIYYFLSDIYVLYNSWVQFFGCWRGRARPVARP